MVNIQVGAPLSGPDRKGGGRIDDSEAPDHGAVAGTRGAVPPGPGSSSPTAAPATPAPAEPAQAQGDRHPKPAEQGERVSGLLLDGTETAAEPAKPVAARSGSLDEGGSGSGLSGAALGLLATVGLLGVGALAESRGAFLSLSGNKATRGVA